MKGHGVRVAVALLVCVGLLWAGPAQGKVEDGAQTDETMALRSTCAVLMDAATGELLYQQNAQEVCNVGTLAKLMALELVTQAVNSGELKLDESISISVQAAKQGGSRAFLDAGAGYTLRQLLQAVGMLSANDACVALAERAAGSTEVFLQRMNQRAGELELKNTSFATCTGWQEGDSSSRSTAADIAKLASALTQDPAITALTGIYMDTLVHPGGRETELVNTNKLVRFYNGCDGLQTSSSGSTNYCGAFTAAREGTRMVAVILGAPSADARSEDAKKLLDYGFANFSGLRIARSGEIVSRNHAVAGGRPDNVALVSLEDCSVVLPRADQTGVEKTIVLDAPLAAPLETGQRVGILEVKAGGQIVAQVPVGVKDAVHISSIARCMGLVFAGWVHATQ